jgi:16S rRNA processing protein RimM
LKGAVRVETLLDDERAFQAGRAVVVRQGDSEVEGRIEFSRIQHGRRILKLHGVQSINETKSLIGAHLAVPEADLPSLGDEVFYTFHLKGCLVESVEGKSLGTVTGVIDGGTPVLQVEGVRGEVLIPFAEAFLRKVDIENRRICVDLPDGLLELNR